MPAKRKQAAAKAEEAALLDDGGTVDATDELDSNDEAAAEDDEEDGEEYDVEEGDFMGDRGDDDEDDEDIEDDDDEEDDDEEEEGDDDDEEEEDEEEDEDDEDEGDDEEEDDEEDQPGHRSVGDLWGDNAEDDDDEEEEDDDDNEENAKPAKVKTSIKSSAAASSKQNGGAVQKPETKGKLTLRGRRRGVREPKEGEILPESDSEEDGPVMRNPVGKIPMQWYRDEKHIGYDLQGKKIIRKPRKDTLDAHLAKADDPQPWRTVYDEVNDEELRLSDAEVKLLTRLRAGKFEPGYNPYEDYPMFEDAPEHKIHPLMNRPEPKSRFVPSKHEAKRIVKYVRMIRAGKVLRPPPRQRDENQYNYDVWEAETDAKFRGAVPIPAPKPKLPGHAESYNPPEEYLLSKEEEEEMLRHDPADRPLNFIPRKFDAFRKVPLYDRLLQERFERCLDLYLCPRTVKKRMNVDPQSLLPSLPKPSELKPYPSTLAVIYEGHTAKVHGLAMHPAGQYFASCSEDRTVRVWEIASGRCHRKWALGASVAAVAWNPNPSTSVLAAAVGSECVLLDMTLGEGAVEEAGAAVEELLRVGREARANRGQVEAKKELVGWKEPSAAESADGILLRISHSQPLTQVAWHHKGDYLVTLAPTANSRAVLIHQLSKMQSQNPFTKSKADARKVLFHPSKPFLFVATKSHVKIYNLQKQTLAKTLVGGFRMLSSFDIHPGGDNVVCSSIDRRLSWFDMDLSTKPYKTLRYNNTGLRSISMHKKLPLFAAGGEDGIVYVFHGMVYQDLMQNPFIVPLKRLHAHKCDKFDGVLDVAFHPTQPWLFTCGVDQTVRMFTER